MEFINALNDLIVEMTNFLDYLETTYVIEHTGYVIASCIHLLAHWVEVVSAY